jgi:hypothetical protein
MVEGMGFSISGSGSRVQGLRFWVLCFGHLLSALGSQI